MGEDDRASDGLPRVRFVPVGSGRKIGESGDGIPTAHGIEMGRVVGAAALAQERGDATGDGAGVRRNPARRVRA